MDLLNIIDTSTCNIFVGTKNFYILQNNNLNIEINLNNVLLPFGSEKYNDKIIINIELENTNTNNNILSKLNKLEENLFNSNINMNVINKNILKNKGLSSIIKQSKLGNIIRTHLLKNTEIFILKKNGENMKNNTRYFMKNQVLKYILRSLKNYNNLKTKSTKIYKIN